MRSLNCAECIESGFVFCIQGEEAIKVVPEGSIVTTCCRDENCPEVSHSEWNCTNPYSDKTYSYNLCPYKTESCGFQQNFTLHEQWDRFDVQIKPMERGDVCVYKVKGFCGAPSFRLTDGYQKDFSVQYLEFNDDDITSNAT